MMLSRSNTAAIFDIGSALEAAASVSVSGASSSGRFHALFLVVNQDLDPIPLRVELRPTDFGVNVSWIDNAFADLEARLSAPPDHDLLNAAVQVSRNLSSSDHSEISEEWIEMTAELWSKYRD